MAATQETLPATQEKLDPRRMGRNNSGLSEQDVSDVVCLLHPTSLAAMKIVVEAALHNPQHVLQNENLSRSENNKTLEDASEADTILLQPTRASSSGQDLALRFSSRVIDPTVGFCFGRNLYKCDINLDPDNTQKRVSNLHFRIYLNDNGMLMLEDLSTNGTVVDGTALGGKKRAHKAPDAPMVQKVPNTRVLQHGSIIEILSLDSEDVIKFILRIPPRDRFVDEYTVNFRNYVHHMQVAQTRAKGTKNMPEAHTRAVMAAPLAGPANSKAIPGLSSSAGYGMHWDGGGTYNCVGVLGKGAFATVYHLATIYEGEYFAAKELDKKRFMKNHQLDTRLENEMNIMQSLRHDNIVQYIDFVESKDYMYIIMEYIPGGDLQGYLSSHRTLQEEPAQAMTRQILDALHYLHQRNITHRDIKPDNILLSSENPFNVKLTDFGLSKVVKNNDTFLKTFCGTLLYCAPEVFPHYQNYMADKRPKRRRQNSGQQRRSYSQLVDIWSYAAVLWTALAGDPPFEGVVDAEGKGMFYQIMQSALDTAPLQESGVSDDACDLLLLMLDTDPTSRPSEAECLRHPWLNNGQWLPDEAAPQDQLHAIEEGDELDASRLSIGEDQENGDKNDSGGSGDTGEAPEAKRARGEDSFVPDEGFIPLFNDTGNHQPPAMLPPSPPKNPRLFGEISHTALKSSGALNSKTGHFDTGYRESQPEGQSYWNGSSNNSGDDGSRIFDFEMGSSHATRDENAPVTVANNQPTKPAGTSLSGAESMVRELQMVDLPHTPADAMNGANESQQRPTDPSGSVPSKDTTPKNRPQRSNHQHSASSSTDKTPRPPRKPVDRQISLPITATSYYDPYNEATHNVAYASRVSGHDFAHYPQADSRAVTSLPETIHASSRSGSVDAISATTSAGALGHEAASEFASDAPSTAPPNLPTEARVLEQPSLSAKQATAGSSEPSEQSPYFGRLVTTSDSFASVTIPLTSRYTTWGRNPQNTHTYPYPTDTRIPKSALELIFDGPGVPEAESAGQNWSSLPGLKVFLLTRSRAGIWVNGVKLQERDGNGRRYYGRLADGDEIEVFRPIKGSQFTEGLKFVVEIAPENAKWTRETGAFEVLKHGGENRYPGADDKDRT